MAFLITADKSVVKKKFEIGIDPISIGRSPECDVVIEDNLVSRRHAQITRNKGHYFIEDLGSRNGTLVNDVEIQQTTRLLDGSEISICDVSFVFQLDDDPNLIRQRTTKQTPAQISASSILLYDEEGMPAVQSSIRSQFEMSSHSSKSGLSSLMPVVGGNGITAEEKLNAIVAVTESLRLAGDEKAIVENVLGSLFDLFADADRGFIAFKTAEGLIVPKAMKTRRSQFEEQIRISRTIVNRVMESKQALLSSDAAADKRFELSQSVADFKIRSMMCAPLLDPEGNSIGVIQLDTLRSSLAFNAGDLEVLATVAVQTSLALQKVELFRRAENAKQLDQDLKLAHEVQLRFLPQVNPELPGYEFFSYYKPTSAVGGDYYDFVSLSEHRMAMIIADVVGHGVAAALMMAKISAEVRFALAQHSDPVNAVRQVNRNFANLNLDKFVTLALAVLDVRKHTLELVNAGHMPPLIRRADGQFFWLPNDRSGMPVGISDRAEYQCENLTMAPGEIFTFYTDGVNEAMNIAGEQLGMDNVLAEMQQCQAKSAEAVVSRMCQTVKQHAAGQPQFDDICIVAVGRR